MSDLGIHPDGVFFYLMLWMSQTATQMTISKEEFTKMMTHIKFVPPHLKLSSKKKGNTADPPPG